MEKKKNGSNAGIIALCIVAILLSICLIVLAVFFMRKDASGQTNRSNTSTAKQRQETEEEETESYEDVGEISYEEIEESHVTFDEASGLQFADNQLLLTTADGVTKEEIEELISPYQAEIVGIIELIKQYQIKFPDSHTREELEEIGEELVESGKVEDYCLNTVMELSVDAVSVPPNDTEWADEWGDTDPSGTNWGMEAIDAEGAWEYYDQMSSVNVGVYDDMFFEHDDLDFSKILSNVEESERTSSHGTHVSGTIGAVYNNTKGVCGVFPKANLYADSFKINGGMAGKKAVFTRLIAAYGCKAINMSFGTPELLYGAARGNQDAINAIDYDAEEIGDCLQKLLDQGKEFVICKAAGNDNSTESFVKADEGDSDAPYGYILYTNDNKSRYAKYENEKKFSKRIVSGTNEGCVEAYDFISAITQEEVKARILVVGSATNLGNGKYKVSDFSNCGSRVDLVAPGEDIYSTIGTNQYNSMNGTSMATPHATGVAAMCFAVNSDLTGSQVVDIIKKTAVGNIKYQIKNGSKKYSYPMLNAKNAVEEAMKDGVARDVVLVLDRSGSMSGEPLAQTKEAAEKFVDTVLEQDSRVALVTYDDSAEVNIGLSSDQDSLDSTIEGVSSGGGTNMYSGLEEADAILENSTADRKIIVLMSDGLPNEGEVDGYGDYSSPLIRYAKELKAKGYYVYTLGFFSSVSYSELYGAQQLMESMASPGYHYEVESAEDLVLFFSDIADQISGKKYVYVRIACPVDVTVSSGGEKLSSDSEDENTRTSFGTLTYESVETESEATSDTEDRVKILRLDMDQDYDIEIEGYGSGTMDYTVSYPSDSGEYDDVREFPNITVTSSTKASSNTAQSDASYLKVDEDGDGTVDTTYKTESNGSMEEVKSHTLLYVILIIVAIVILLVVLVILIVVAASGKKKNTVQEVNICGYVYGAFGIYAGQQYPMWKGRECVVGRMSSCDIQLVHGQVSRTHCKILMMHDGVYQVTDYSTNGTYYNNQKLNYGEPYRLPKGALLAIGDADNVLELR